MFTARMMLDIAYGVDRDLIREDPKLAITRGDLPYGAFEIYKTADGQWRVYCVTVQCAPALQDTGVFASRDEALAHLDRVREKRRAGAGIPAPAPAPEGWEVIDA